MKRLNKYGMPNRRQCTCKVDKTKFIIDAEGDKLTCPTCHTLHCPCCLKSCADIEITKFPFAADSHWGTNVSGNCPHCDYLVIDYDYQ